MYDDDGMPDKDMKLDVKPLYPIPTLPNNGICTIQPYIEE